MSLENFSSEYQCFCDGGARGNPGPAASAFVILDQQSNITTQFGRFLGTATNNQAEYQAVTDALSWIYLNLPPTISIKMFLDSKLVVEQVSGRYKIKDPILSLHYQSVARLLNAIRHTTVTYIPRAQNSQADRLVNQILDLHQ